MPLRAVFWLAWGVIILAWVSSMEPAQAAPAYRYAFDRPVYAGPLGAQVDVQVFLEERLQPGDTSLLRTAGLSSAAVKLSYLSPKPTQPAWLNDKAFIFHNPLFDDPLTPEKYLTADILAEDPLAEDPIAAVSQWVSIVPPAPGGAIADEVIPGELNRILLGTFRFTLGHVLGEVTQIRATDLFEDLDETVSFNFVVLDGLIASAEAWLVTVPEPGTVWGVLGALASGLVYWRFFRRQSRFTKGHAEQRAG